MNRVGAVFLFVYERNFFLSIVPDRHRTEIRMSSSERSEVKFDKHFNWWSLLGIAFSLSCSWVGISASMAVGIASGGPLLIIYGLIIAAFFSLMCGISLGDFAAILPNSSGGSFWVLKMLEQESVTLKTPEYEDPSDDDEEVFLENYCQTVNVEVSSKFQKVSSMVVGLLNYFGAIFTTASICSSLSMSCIGIHKLLHPDYELKHWHVFVGYECINAVLTLFNIYSTPLPYISQFGLYTSLLSFAMTFIICIVSRSDNTVDPWPKASNIFGSFDNQTGWNSSGMAFVVGLVNPIWAFVGIDSATHMIDEVGYSKSRFLVPKVIITTIIVGFVTSFIYCVGLFFCITDQTAVVESILPIVEIFYQATGNRNLSVFLQCMCITTGFVSGIASGTWQSRILQSFGKSYAPFYKEGSLGNKSLKKLAVLTPGFKSPLYAHFLSQICVTIIGCIFMGSSTAFNAIITACITLLLMSYAVPSFIFLFVIRKEKFIHRIESDVNCVGRPNRRRMSMIPHIICILWTLFCLVFLSFPYTLPVTAGNMNYTSVVYAVVFCIISIVVCPTCI